MSAYMWALCRKKPFLPLIAFFIAIPAFFWGALQGGEKPPFASYRDIPGITEAEIAAVEALRERYGGDSALVYGVMRSTEAFKGHSGEICGFAALVCRHLSELFGIPIKTELYEWGDMIAGLRSGEVHFTGELTPTEKRKNEGGYFMTGAITNRSIMKYRLEGGEPLEAVAKTRPLRYGFFEGASTVDVVLGHTSAETEVLLISDFSDVSAMLKSGRIDVFFDENTAQSIFDDFGGFSSEYFLPLVYEPVSLSTQIAELAPIISITDKFLQNGGLNYFIHLYRLGNREYAANRIFMALTEEEKAFINSKPTVLYAAEYDNYPISFYNTNEKQWQGIAIDALREAGILTGINFKIVNEPGVAFLELLKSLESGKVSMISELIRTDKREGKFLWAGTPLLSSKYALITKTDRPAIEISEILGIKVGVQQSTAYAEQFHRWFQNHPAVIEYSNFIELFDVLERGDIDAIMTSHKQLLAVTNYMERPNYKANLLFNSAFESSLGFNIGDSLLCSIVDKALQHINLQNITDEWMNRTYDYRVKLAHSRIPFMAGLSALLLCVVILLLALSHKSHTMGRRLEKLVKERTEELGVALEAAQTASRAKSVFLANMTHEIRTPMNSINGFAELALDYHIPDKPKEYLGKIMENSQWLLQIINDILDVSKIEAGKVTLENVPFDLHRIFMRCQITTIQRAVEKGLVLHMYAEPFVGKRLIGDPTKLCQIFINLISNAIKFTNVGTIKVSATVMDTADHTVTIRFEVRDSGVGMTIEEIERVSEPFVQADDSVTRKYGGTGLGLAIIRNYVEMMGGQLNVESSPGIGSKFSFDLTFDTIDTADGDDTAADFETDIIEKPAFDGEVLVCEDNNMNQEVIRKHLERIGLQTIIVGNGKLGLETVKDRAISGEKMFDLVLMDINMPIMDGLEASEKIIALDTGVPVVAMTANVMPTDKEVYRKSGMHDCIGKPFTSQELWRCLLKYLKPVEEKTGNGSTPAAASVKTVDNTLPFYGDEMLLELLTIFVEDNQNTFAEFTGAIDSGDIKSAHRIAHTLKSNAGTIGKQALQNVAEKAEKALLGGVNALTKELSGNLESELNAVLQELAPLLGQNSTDQKSVQPERASINDLPFIDTLENFLRDGNPESKKFTEALGNIPGCEKLIHEIENFDFDDAASTLAALRKNGA